MQTISPLDISHFDVRFYNEKTQQEEMRQTDSYEQFYVLTSVDRCFKQESTTVEVTIVLAGINYLYVYLFSEVCTNCRLMIPLHI